MRLLSAMPFAASALAVTLTMPLCGYAQSPTTGCVEGPTVVGGDYDGALLAQVLALRPICVRVRFRLDLWQSVTDTAQRGPRDTTLFGARGVYDDLLRRIRRTGASVVLTADLDAANVSPAQLDDSAARARYAQALYDLTLQVRGQIWALELAGAPNERAAGASTPDDRISPARYAAMLVTAQTRLRSLESALRCEMPRVLVGGVLDAPEPARGSTATGWLSGLYDALATLPEAAALRTSGREVIEDLAAQVRAEAQPGFAGPHLRDGAEGMLWSLDALYRGRLAAVPAPRVWITAGAYRTDGSPGEDQRQALEAQAYFNASAFRDAPIRPQVITWSPVIEAPGACVGYGLFRGCRPLEDQRRFTYSVVFNGMTSTRPDPWARLEFTEPTLRVAAGDTVSVQLRVYNESPDLSTTLPWTAGTDLWIAQPIGCPDNVIANQIPWTALAPGSVESMTVGGARLRFIPATLLPSTASTVVSWRLAPPRSLAPGTYALAARLQQGTRWFGDGATATLEVLAPTPSDAGVADAAPPIDARTDAGDAAGIDGGASPDVTADREAPRDAAVARDGLANNDGPRDSTTHDVSVASDLGVVAPDAITERDATSPTADVTDGNADVIVSFIDATSAPRDDGVRAPSVTYDCRCRAGAPAARVPVWLLALALLTRRRRSSR